MCSRSECKRCGKASFIGCGMHVEQILHDVAPADRCVCRPQARAAQPSKPPERKSWVQQLLKQRS
jgi:hypothetical protein